jgi:hypothetical protein
MDLIRYVYPAYCTEMCVKLVDFEFAYHLGDVIEDDRCGTYGYSAPEWRKAIPRVADPRTNKQLKVRSLVHFLFVG